MFLNNLSADGGETEGLGSVLAFKLMSYGISRSLNMNFVDNEFINIVGHTYENLKLNEFNKFLNKNFKFDYKNCSTSNKNSFDIFFDYPGRKNLSSYERYINIKKRDLFFWLFNQNIKKIRKNNYLTDLLDIKKFTNKDTIFKNDVNIAIHLRSPLQDIDVRFEGARNVFYGSYSDIDKVNNLINQLEHSENNKILNFHIVSTGSEDRFEKFKNLYDRNKIYLHLNKNIFDSFNILCHADLLVLSGSGLSYCAHLLNVNRSLIPEQAHAGKRSHYDDSIFLDANGFLPKLNYSYKII